MITKRIETLMETLREMLNDERQPEEETWLVAMHIQKQIWGLVKLTHQYNREYLAVVDVVEGEKIGKTWSNQHKERKPRDMVKCLNRLDAGGAMNSPKEMAEVAATYHERIQHNDQDPTLGPGRTTLENVLNPIRAKLSEASKGKLCEDIDKESVREAIRNTNPEKAPGLDGIPVELWKAPDSQFQVKRGNNNTSPRCNIVWVLTQVYWDIEEYGMDMEAGFNEGCITPIYKKDPDNIANYRPITLLNTDYKVYTKAISICLAGVVPKVVNQDQAGFIQGEAYLTK